MAWNKYPYTDNHELNLDWFLEQFKQLLAAWSDLQAAWTAYKTDLTGQWEAVEAAWQTYKTYIDEYFNNLNVQIEINNKIDGMVASGEFLNIISPTVVLQTTSETSRWLAEHIAQETGYVLDTSLTVAGAAADAKAAGDAVNDLREDLNGVVDYYSDVYTKASSNLFDFFTIQKDKGLTNAEGTIVDNTSAWICGKMILPDIEGFIRSSHYIYKVIWYDENDNYLSVSEGNYIVRTVPAGAKAFQAMFLYDNTPISNDIWIVQIQTNYNNLYMQYYAPLAKTFKFNKVMNDRFNSIELNYLSASLGESIIDNYEYDISAMDWEIGSIFSANGSNQNGMAKGLRTKYPVRMYANTVIKNSATFNQRYIKYDENWNFIEAGPTTTAAGSVIIPETGYYRITFWNNSLAEDITDPSVYYDDITIMGLDKANKQIINNYVIDAAFNKQPKKLLLLGQITKYQSFCIYNNKIYSTDGESISVQDADTMALENTVSISVGHGNGFQLGSSNLGYISGWNDNTIYVFNLDTLTLDRTITLPTNGFTTCAVDDINNLIYIFRLEGNPNTGGYYDFITYDYNNEQIISTKKITFWIRDMQSIDFYKGRIIMASGRGTATDGNKYAVFNTNGDVISEIVIGDLEYTEPEGICIDRNSREIYISYLITNVGNNLYKLVDL